jgi:predicted Na+-dependent transporter
VTQTRRRSAVEAVTNVAVGYTINMLANFLIFPLFGWEISLTQNLAVGVIYTIISLVRSYGLRRLFNSL